MIKICLLSVLLLNMNIRHVQGISRQAYRCLNQTTTRNFGAVQALAAAQLNQCRRYCVVLLPLVPTVACSADPAAVISKSQYSTSAVSTVFPLCLSVVVGLTIIIDCYNAKLNYFVMCFSFFCFCLSFILFGQRLNLNFDFFACSFIIYFFDI